MPTGYTADVQTGKVTDLRTFALRCARAFGATIMQSDDDARELPKHREPSDWSVKAAEKARAELAEVLTLHGAALTARVDEEHAPALAAYTEREQRRTESANRYSAMLARVVEWTPPTPEHEGLKRFMLTQLRESKDFDCGNSFDRRPQRPTDEKWKEDRIAKCSRDLLYHEEEARKEVKRCEEANAWIDALYASLPEEVPHVEP